MIRLALGCALRCEIYWLYEVKISFPYQHEHLDLPPAQLAVYYDHLLLTIIVLVQNDTCQVIIHIIWSMILGVASFQPIYSELV